MNLEDIQEINTFFEDWRGSSAAFNRYTNTHDRFVLALSRPDRTEFIGVSFILCEYISGPIRWSNCDLHCKAWQDNYGNNGYEVEDKKAGFLVRGSDGILFGDEPGVLPKTKKILAWLRRFQLHIRLKICKYFNCLS